MGESGLKSHAGSDAHKANEKAGISSVPIGGFFTKTTPASNSVSNTGGPKAACASSSTSSANVASAASVANQTMKSQILWVLKIHTIPSIRVQVPLSYFGTCSQIQT
jgi:hypothetical protein